MALWHRAKPSAASYAWNAPQNFGHHKVDIDRSRRPRQLRPFPISISIVTIMGPTEVIFGFLPNDYPQPVQWQILQLNQVRQPLLGRRVPNLNEAWSDYRLGHPPETIYYCVLPVARVPARVSAQARIRATHLFVPSPMLDLLS
jgi:hypothetical protein